jgi:SAM-dependent methyltransferase
MTEEEQLPSWADGAIVDRYLERIERLEPRAAGDGVLRELLPDTPRRVLDLGCGDGRVTALVLEARPDVEHVTAVDLSPPMLERAHARFSGDARVEVRRWDLAHDIGPLGRFDLVVSAFAIHHVDDDRKRALYGEVAAALEPGGLFANLEIVRSATPELHAEFLAAIGRPADDPEDRLAEVEPQLGWLRDAGLTQVDCLWRWRGMALLFGRSPEG